ncbi:MAG: class I SAM-dependent RNA methyltransferase [Acidimicrobiia bacterium]
MSDAFEHELVPTAMVAGGRAMARGPDGRVVFIAGALPGERVRVAVDSEHRGYLTARVLEVLEPSADRVDPPCPELARGCGACQWQHVSVGAQQSLKRDIVFDALRRIGRLDVNVTGPTVALPPWSYRTTVRAGVTNGRAGFRRARSHSSVAVDDCLVAHPLLLPLITEARYPGAHEVLLRCGSRTGDRLAVPTPKRVRVAVPDGVRNDFIHEYAAGQRWRISAASFFQSRADGVDELAKIVGGAADELGITGTALDLYSGVGLFAGVLCGRGWTVSAVESSNSAVDDARTNLRSFDATVVAADVTRWSPIPADFVVADPSRGGLGRKGVATVQGSGARRLVLVSCDAASLGRDVALLRQAGFSLTALTFVDMFPHTFHVEVVSIFDR